ncbi:MAG: amidohydrolase family protein, partial [Saprospiraceae bacterium]
MKNISFTYLLLLGCFLVKAQTETTKIAIINAAIIEVEQGQLKQNQTILIEDGLIKDIRKSRKRKPKGARIIDAKGKFILPGLVDAHIHFFQSGGLYTRPDAIDLRKYVPYEEEIAWLKKEAGTIAKRYLQAGITTIVDVGGPMYNYTIREALKDDKSSPSIYLTGPLVSTYQPEEFKIPDPPIVKVNNTEEARALVQKQIPLKPDFIKIWFIVGADG